jgi:hypothetical protein
LDTEASPLDVLQVTACVRSFVVLSVKMPVAANCCDVPSGMLLAAGVTPIETTVAAVTTSVAVPVIPRVASTT